MITANYASVMPTISVNFKDTMRALPSMEVARQDNALVFDGKTYKHALLNSPMIVTDEYSNNNLGLRCDASRRLLAGNTIQTVDPTTQRPYDTEVSSGTFTVISNGYEDGIPYNDIRVVSDMANGFASFFPFMIAPVTEISNFSAYIKKISGNFSSSLVHLNLRHHNLDHTSTIERTTPLFSITGTENTPLRKTRKNITTPASNILTNAVTSCLIEFIGRESIDGVFRLGCPQLVSGSNMIAPLPTARNNLTTRAATKYHLKRLPGMRNEGCFVIEATTHNTESNWQDIFILSDSQYGFSSLVGLSFLPDGSLNIASGTKRITIGNYANKTFKIAINWGNGSNSVAINGEIVGTIEDTIGLVPQSLQLGSTIGELVQSSPFTGEIGGFSIYSQKLNNKELIALTKDWN